MNRVTTLLLALLFAACSDGGPSGVEPILLSVGGEYSAAVEIINSQCGDPGPVPGVVVNVAHVPGEGTFSAVTRGSTPPQQFAGEVDQEGAFGASTSTAGSDYQVVGTFDASGFTATVTRIIRGESCTIQYDWEAGRVSGSNTVPGVIE